MVLQRNAHRNYSGISNSSANLFNLQIVPSQGASKFILASSLEDNDMSILPLARAYNPFDRGGEGEPATLEIIDIVESVDASCLGDSNNDGSVDVLDLLEVIGNFGEAC